MPGVIDSETLYIDDLPTIWSPVQWDLTESERQEELEQQATASMLWSADVPETILRLLLDETGIQRAFGPPPGYNPDEQGEWDESLVTFQFRRPIRLESMARDGDSLQIEYNFGELGHWWIEISPEKVTIEKI